MRHIYLAGEGLAAGPDEWIMAAPCRVVGEPITVWAERPRPTPVSQLGDPGWGFPVPPSADT